MSAQKVIFLLHHTGTGASANAKVLCGVYGYNLFYIDLIGSLPPGPTVFTSLDHARKSLIMQGWNWVFFDQQASDSLFRFHHQFEKIVYVFGSDTEGWDRSLDDLPGTLVKIPPNVSHTQAFCSETVINHRYYQRDAA